MGNVGLLNDRVRKGIGCYQPTMAVLNVLETGFVYKGYGMLLRQKGFLGGLTQDHKS